MTSIVATAGPVFALARAGPRRGLPWPRERRRRVLLALVSLVYLLAAAVGTEAVLQPPRLAARLLVPAGGSPLITWIVPGSTLWERGVRNGDRVLRLDGSLPARPGSEEWRGNTLLVRTGSGSLVAADAATDMLGRETWPLLAISPVFLLLASLIFLRAPRPIQGRAAYGLFGSAAFALALAPGADADIVAASIAEWLATGLFGASFLTFFLVYPAVRGSAAVRHWLYAPSVLGLIGGVVSLAYPDWYGTASGLRLLVLLLYLAAGTALLARSWVTTSDRAQRRGLGVIAVATLASVAPLALLYAAPAVVGQPPLLAAEPAAVALVIMPAAFVYAILRYKVIDVSLFQRWLVHAVVGGGLAVLYGALALLAWQAPHAARLGPATVLLAGAAFAALVGATFPFCSGRLCRAADRRLFGDVYDYRATLQGLSHDLSLMAGAESLGHWLPDRLARLLHLDYVALLAAAGGSFDYLGTAGQVPAGLATRLVPLLGNDQAGRDQLPPEEPDGGGLLVPLVAEGRLVGCLCLGAKRGGEPFGAGDRAMLETLRGHLAAVLRGRHLAVALRARLADLETQGEKLEELNGQLLRVEEEERRRLAADLHDEPLQTAQQLRRWMAEGTGQRPDDERGLALSITLIAQLRAICNAALPPALDELGLAAALMVLARDLTAAAGIPVQAEVDPEVEEMALPAALALVLYRAAQEAAHNSLRHASPSGVWISLARTGDTLCLRVRDDGVGFVVPSPLESGTADGHLGLAGLSRRISRAHGLLAVASAPGAGTTVEVRFTTSEGGIA